MLLATLNLPKSLTFLRNFCKGVKIYHFYSKISIGQVLQTFGDFFLVTLIMVCLYCFGTSLTLQLTTWADTSLHLFLIKGSLVELTIR